MIVIVVSMIELFGSLEVFGIPDRMVVVNHCVCVDMLMCMLVCMLVCMLGCMLVCRLLWLL